MANINLKTPITGISQSGQYPPGTVEMLLLDDIAFTLREILKVLKEKK